MLYITYVNLNDKGYTGIRKKILGQVHSLEQRTNKRFYTQYCGQMIYLMCENEIKAKKIAISKAECNEIILQWIEEYQIKEIYIRYDYSDIFFIDFIRKLKERNVKMVLEFPTIPYDLELAGGVNNCHLIEEDKYYRKQLHNYVDKCTTYSKDENVFGIPVLSSLINGIENFEYPVCKKRIPDDRINLIAVASMCKWHGYERIIKGMANAKSTLEKVYLMLVGDGPEIPYYMRLVKQYNLSDYVTFYGRIEGTKLTDLYNRADIALGSLALYKTDVYEGAPIKLRDYCARGIPFIYGYNDLGFSGKEKYALKVPNDASIIDMKDVIKFYNNTVKDYDYSAEMRKYAASFFTWDHILEPVIEYLYG